MWKAFLFGVSSRAPSADRAPDLRTGPGRASGGPSPARRGARRSPLCARGVLDGACAAVPRRARARSVGCGCCSWAGRLDAVRCRGARAVCRACRASARGFPAHGRESDDARDSPASCRSCRLRDLLRRAAGLAFALAAGSPGGRGDRRMRRRARPGIAGRARAARGQRRGRRRHPGVRDLRDRERDPGTRPRLRRSPSSRRRASRRRCRGACRACGPIGWPLTSGKSPGLLLSTCTT